MEEKLFTELVESMEYMVEVEKGGRSPERSFTLESVRSTRERYGLSQNQFAQMMGISVRTLQNWEQGHRTPTGAARVLLEVVTRHPEVVLETIKTITTR